MAVKINDIVEYTAGGSSTSALGEYTFEVFPQDIPAENITTIWVRCYKNGVLVGQKGKDFPLNTTLVSWHVEANDTTADVYATYIQENASLKSGAPSAVKDELYATIIMTGGVNPNREFIATNAQRPVLAGIVRTDDWVYAWLQDSINDVNHNYANTVRSVNVDGVKFYFNTDYAVHPRDVVSSSGTELGTFVNANEAAEYLARQYFSFGEQQSSLLARFAIDLHDAGGTGPGSDWYDPGDWNADPSTVLHLTVTGATSGRHNDPLENPAYSYLPSKNTNKAFYGCGGDGGHGGGGGGGASTEIIRKFSTNKASSKDIQAIIRRHGYGSGGGEGADGGPGCILIFH